MDMTSPSSGNDCNGNNSTNSRPTDQLSAEAAGTSVSRGIPRVILENTLHGPEATPPPESSEAQTGSPPAAEYGSDLSEGMGTFGMEPEKYVGRIRRRVASNRGTPLTGPLMIGAAGRNQGRLGSAQPSSAASADGKIDPRMERPTRGQTYREPSLSSTCPSVTGRRMAVWCKKRRLDRPEGEDPALR